MTANEIGRLSNRLVKRAIPANLAATARSKTDFYFAVYGKEEWWRTIFKLPSAPRV